jgi:shikimate kinase
MAAELAGGRSRVVLVGFMGAGKTRVGRLLADLLQWDFVDLDALVVARKGKPIPTIFRDEGEAAFRLAEHAAAVEATRAERVVIASGGGAFAASDTRAVLSAGAVTVWLRCALPAILKRVAHDGSRPLAANRETISALLSEREPIYRLADLVVDTTTAAPRQTAREIAAAILGPGAIEK